MAQHRYKFQIPLRKHENLLFLLGYDPKTWCYIKEENIEFGPIACAIMAEEYEKADSLNYFRLKIERKLYNAKDDLLKRPWSHLLRGVRCITAATPEKDLIIATYLDLDPLRTFTWPRACPREILFYAIIKEKTPRRDHPLQMCLQKTPRVITESFNWLYEMAPLENCSESNSSSSSDSDSDDSNLSGLINQNSIPITHLDTDGEDADCENNE